MNTINTIVAAIVLIVAFSLLMAVPTMLLWDWLMPTIFNLKEITLLQAWGLNFLCNVLFKSHNNK